jgi:hypothetical protein
MFLRRNLGISGTRRTAEEDDNVEGEENKEGRRKLGIGSMR